MRLGDCCGVGYVSEVRGEYSGAVVKGMCLTYNLKPVKVTSTSTAAKDSNVVLALAKAVLEKMKNESNFPPRTDMRS